MKGKSDEHLMHKVKKGQTDNVSVLFNRYNLQLYNFFYSLTKNQAQSEDLTQNVFLRIINYKQSYDESKPFKTWMFRIARTQFYNYIEKIKRDDDAILNQIVVSNDDSEISDQYLLLDKALDNLSIETKELILLAKFQKYKYQELAEIFNTTEGAIKVKVHRAINELRKKYFELLNQ